MAKFRAVCLLIILSLISASVFWQPPTTKADVFNNQIIVKLRAGALIDPIANALGLTVVDRLTDKQEYLLSVPRLLSLNLVISILSNTLGVENVGPNTVAYSLAQPTGFTGDKPIVLGTDSNTYRNQELNTFLKTSSLGSYSTGEAVKVAVIDTGIDLFHPELSGKVLLTGYDYVDRDDIPQDELGGSKSGHGTFIAGLISLVAPQAQILPMRVLDTNGVGNAFHISAAIYRAADQNAKVINLSLGTDQDTGMLRRAVTYAQSKGSVVTVAVGNSNSNANNISPANYSNVLGVAATDFKDQKASFSNYGSSVSLTAPGVDLVSAFPGGFYARWNGTSFSTSLASAQAALLSAEGKNANTIMATMKASAIRVQSSYSLGYGRIDPLKSVSEY